MSSVLPTPDTPGPDRPSILEKLVTLPAHSPELVKNFDRNKVVFSPTNSMAAFWHSNDFYQFVIGPLGSTKTANCIFKMLAYAQLQPKQADGIRRSRFVIARPTLQQIKTTVLKDIEFWLGAVARFKVSESKIEIRTDDVESDWYLIPLESVEDQRRLLSMQLTGVYFNEFREIPFELVSAAVGRVGRFPAEAHGGCTWCGIIADSNPPGVDSAYYKFLVENPPAGLHFTHQPSALSPEADWRHLLRAGYYENMMSGHADDWVDIHVHSKWGETKSGQAVYKHSFKKEFHVSKNPLLVDRSRPLIIGMDFARWPAAVLCQLDNVGRLLVFQELEMENTGAEKFLITKLLPMLSTARFAGASGYVIGDPSGVARSSIGEESVFSMLNKRMNIPAYPAMTNLIDPRLRAVEKFLLQQRDGGPALLIDPVGCPLLIRGFIYEYRYKTRTDGSQDDTPDKTNRPFPDLHDALQYAALGTASSIRSRVFKKTPTKSHSITPGSWT